MATKHLHKLLFGKGTLFMGGKELGKVSDLSITTEDGVQTLNTVMTMDGPLPVKTVKLGDTPEEFMLPKAGVSPSLKLMMLKKNKEKAVATKMTKMIDWDSSPYAPEEDPDLHKYMIDFSVMNNVMTMTVEACFKFVFGSTLRVSLPEKGFPPFNHKNLMPLLDYATKHGFLSYDNHNPAPTYYSLTGHVAPVPVPSSLPNYVMLVGGPQNGELIQHSAPQFASLTTPPGGLSAFMHHADDPIGPTTEVTHYYREHVAFDTKGLTSTAPIYRHQSIPPSEASRMFELMLDEFPLLRCVPIYSLFWWSKNQ